MMVELGFLVFMLFDSHLGRTEVFTSDRNDSRSLLSYTIHVRRILSFP